MAEHEAREKSFSLGRFDERYLQAGGIAIARFEHRIVAFASVQITDQHIDSVVDLMLYRPDAPRGAMDFLFANTHTHLQPFGSPNFGLAMEPMSGMIVTHLDLPWPPSGPGRKRDVSGQRFSER